MSRSRILLLCNDPFLVTDITWCAQRAGFDVTTARYQESACYALIRTAPDVVLVHREHEGRLAKDFLEEARKRNACVLTFDKHPARDELRIFGSTSRSVQLRRGQEAAFYSAVVGACAMESPLQRAG